ncbi:hypothetical protein CROQUDRAFT_39766 [Cronartium quercuum f. sp. fusiforme G11]|uniref:Nuclear pore complex protein n=1 Tax=Cronartium quercuum f. sp. fusiforme G11 TaxID=708437 RepID=A0A9P6NTW9_9BASI|nr:hypothetical protein CROQUDRAFT_39766 [Cronartium quercuum f. sp. fusiforme G11]
MAPSTYPSFTTATIFLDSLRPAFEPVVEYEVPTSASNSDPASVLQLPSTQSAIQPIHASQSVTHFLSTSHQGFVKASVLNDGYSLELRWLSANKLSPSSDDQEEEDEDEDEEGDGQSRSTLDRSGSHPPVQFRFPDKIIPTPYLATNPDDGTLIILVLTQAAVLYRLKFTEPHLFYAELFEEDWATDIEVEAIVNRLVILYHGIDANNLVISSSDGVLTHLSWGKLVGIEDAYGWKSSNLTTRAGLWGLLPTWSSSKTVSSSAHEWVATPGSTISIASHVTAGGSGEDGWIFTITRDRKLRVWSLASGECLRELSLGSSLETDDQRRQTGSLLPAAPRSLARFIYSDQGDDPAYEGFLVVFVPSTFSPSFLTYGMSMTSDHRFSNLVLLEERACDFQSLDLTTTTSADLRDFRISRLDLAHPIIQHKPWALWTVWDDEAGGEGIIRSVLLHETRGWQELSRSAWVTIQPPDRATPWNSTFFDELITANPNLSVTEVFIEHLFRPGHYPPSTLEYALACYEESLVAEGGTSNREGDFETLEEKICAVVGSNVRLEISPVSGSPMMDLFHRKLRIEWLKFAAMCSESRASALWPLELAVDPDRQLLLVVGRRSITCPVLVDTASLVTQLAKEEAAGLQPVMLRQMQVPQLERLHPLLSDLQTRVDLVALINTMTTLLDGLSRVEAIRPLEDELLQILRRPPKYALVDMAEDLFSRRLEAFIDDELQAKVSAHLGRVSDLGQTLEVLWNVLTTSELVHTDPDTGSVAKVGSPTVLSQMLLADTLTSAIENRYTLAKHALVLLLFIYGEEELDPRFARLLSNFLGTFHQASMLRFIARQSSRVSPELAFELEEQDLADQLDALQVSAPSSASAATDEARCATGLVSSLLLTKFVPEIDLTTPHAVSLAQAGANFLDQTGLARRTPDAETGTRASARNVQFIHFLLRVGLTSLALELIDQYALTTAGLTFLKALALLDLGQVEDAEDGLVKASSALYDPNFQIDDESGLARVLPPEAAMSLRAYYNYVVGVLEVTGADLAVARFCQLALDEEDGYEENEGSRALTGELWTKLFKCFVNLRLWDDAYTVLISIPFTDLKHNCLRTLVSGMAEANEVDKLMRFSFLGLQQELERTLAFRARNSDPLAQPNYHQMLYAYHITKGDYRSAALAMYQHGRRIADVSAKAASAQVVMILLTQQCQSYLAAINALALVATSQAWLPIPTKRSTLLSSGLPPTTGTLEIDLLSLADLRSEYNLALTALELANAHPHLSLPTTLDASTLMPMLVNACRVRDALKRAGSAEIRNAIFRSLAESCCQLTDDSEGFDHDWVLADPRAAGWDGSLAARGWRVLKLELEKHGDSQARVAVVEAVLETAGAVKVPLWLIEAFESEEEEEGLVRVFVRYGWIEDGFTVLISALVRTPSLSLSLSHSFFGLLFLESVMTRKWSKALYD